MKKRMFKVLCVVLVMALLAPNVFAATPAPEVPLADAATVARVQQEIASGQITDMEDLFLVAYQHLGADLEEEGMTAYINEDGTLGFTQIINNNNNDASLFSTNGDSEEFILAVSTLAFIDEDGSFVTAVPYVPQADYSSVTVDGTSISVLQTAYYNGRGLLLEYPSENGAEIQLSYMVTSISGSGASHTVVSFVQNYMHKYFGIVDEQASRTVIGVVNGPYSFTPSQRSWYPVWGQIGALVTTAELTISGIAETITVQTTFSQYEFDGNIEN